MRRSLMTMCLVVLSLVVAPRAWAVQPSTKVAIDPERVGVPYEDLVFPSARDSVRLHGWWFEAGPNTPVVVCVPRGHGNMADLLPSVREFISRGFTVMTFDYREFGPGGPGEQDSLANLVFASRWVDDSQGACELARRRAGSRFVMGWGQDLGASCVVAVGARDHLLLDGLCCEGLIRTAQEQLLWNGTAQIPDVAKHHRLVVDGADEPLSAVQRLLVPMLVVLAGKDVVTPPKVTRDVTRQSLTRIDRYELPVATHEGAELTPGYFDRVAGWFKWLASALPPRDTASATH